MLCLKVCIAWLFALTAAEASAGTVEIDPSPQVIFAGGKRRIETKFTNLTDTDLQLTLHSRLFQASSATIVPVDESKASRPITIASGQSLIERVEQSIPEVKSETLFVLYWSNRTQKIGATFIRAIPTNVLSQLPQLNDGHAVALYDPGDALKSAFGASETVAVKSVDDLASSESKLLIWLPEHARERRADESSIGVISALKKKAQNGGAIVRLNPAPVFPGEISGSTHTIQVGSGRIVCAYMPAITDYSQAAAQLMLLRLSELATGARKFPLNLEN